MALYLFESSLCWLLFYGFYALTLSRETFFQLNRWYLLSTLALGAIIPHFEIPAGWVTQAPEVALSAWLPMAEVGAMPTVVVTTTSVSPAFDIWAVLMPVYWLGVAFASLRFLLGVSQIFRLYFKGQKIRHAAYTLVLTDPGRLPFSFGRWLFVSRDNHFSEAETEKIIRHELAHIRGRHTADVLLMEIFCMLLWWSPAVYLYRRSLRTVHEYLADHAVLRTARRKEYGHLLIRQAQSGMQPVLANYFFHSQLKKRIKMMTKMKSGKRALAKYLTVFPLLVLAMLLFANREALAQAKSSDSPIASDPIFKVVEEMPRFPGAGCENSELSTAAKKECADRAMLEFIYKNIKYPKAARDAGAEGIAVVSFVVDQTGKIRDAKVVRDIGMGTNEEVLRLVGEMPDWIPGKQRGQTVNVQFNLPIRFKLDTSEPEVGENAKPQPQPAFPIKEGNWEPDKFSASPNPAANQVRVYFETEAKSVYISIDDVASKLIFEENVTDFNGVYDKTFDLAGVPKGMVRIIVIGDGKGVYLHKLLVQ